MIDSRAARTQHGSTCVDCDHQPGAIALPADNIRRQRRGRNHAMQVRGGDVRTESTNAALKLTERCCCTDVEHGLPMSGAMGADMNEQEFQSKLAELMGEISTLPLSERNKLEKLADETRQRHERLKKTVSSLQESLDYLRLSIKYLVFDLEATRRENGYLRKMLEETTGNNE
jgi:hypothetical protein